MLILSAPGVSIACMSSTVRMPPPTVSGMKHCAGGALDHIDHRGAAVSAGGDVEEYHLVRALVVVTHGELHRVADIAQSALFGAAKLHAARDLSVVNVQAGNDAFREHEAMAANKGKPVKGRARRDRESV